MMDYAADHRRALLGKRKPMRESVKTILSVLALFVAYSVVGTMDYEDAVASEIEARNICGRTT